MDWDNTSVDLKWEAPKSDGGAPIEKYVVEKKDRFGTDWEKAAEVPGSKTDAKVTGLKEGNECQFRVVAVNKAGPSEPSDATQMHTVKHRKCESRSCTVAQCSCSAFAFLRCLWPSLSG